MRVIFLIYRQEIILNYNDKWYGAKNFEENNVLYNYQPDRVKLVFGKFCAIVAETKFIMTGDHKLDVHSNTLYDSFASFFNYVISSWFIIISKSEDECHKVTYETENAN